MKKPLFYLIVLVIFFFLGKTLFDNWQKVREYQFSFNYFYLIISLIFPILTIISFAFIWNRILRILDPQNKISNFKALKIFIYSWFGRYAPGKVLQPLGQVYLGAREGLSPRILTISVVFENVLFVISAFLFSLLSLSINFGSQMPGFYYIIGGAIIAGGFVVIHPKIFYPCLNFVLRKFKKAEVDSSSSLGYKEIIEIIFYDAVALTLTGIGFFFLINSIIYLPWQNIVGVIGIYTMAGIMGIIAFMPSGLGVREGVLAGLLQFYFPMGLAVLISLIARFWVTLSELLLLGFTCLTNYGKK